MAFAENLFLVKAIGIKANRGLKKMSLDDHMIGSRTTEEKASNPRFISSVKLQSPPTKVPIPEEADLLRTAQKMIKFFQGTKPEGNANGWYDIPEGAIEVCFPDYRERPGHCVYGDPQYIIEE